MRRCQMPKPSKRCNRPNDTTIFESWPMRGAHPGVFRLLLPRRSKGSTHLGLAGGAARANVHRWGGSAHMVVWRPGCLEVCAGLLPRVLRFYAVDVFGQPAPYQMAHFPRPFKLELQTITNKPPMSEPSTERPLSETERERELVNKELQQEALRFAFNPDPSKNAGEFIVLERTDIGIANLRPYKSPERPIVYATVENATAMAKSRTCGLFVVFKAIAYIGQNET